MVIKAGLITDFITETYDVWLDTVDIKNSVSKNIKDYNTIAIYNTKLFYESAKVMTLSLTSGVITSDYNNDLLKLCYLFRQESPIYVLVFGENTSYLGVFSTIKIYNDVSGQMQIQGTFSYLNKYGYFLEAEDAYTDGTVEYLADASNDFVTNCNSQFESVYFTLQQNNYSLPIGDLVIIARINCSAAVAGDLNIYVYNDTDSTWIINQNFNTVVGWQYISLDFTIADDDLGDTIRFNFSKLLTTGNAIKFDYIGFASKVS